MTDRNDGREKTEEAERRELEAAGWEAKGRGPKTIWRSPGDGHWYAHYQAVVMLDKEVKKIVAEGKPRDLQQNSGHPWVRQFFNRAAET